MSGIKTNIHLIILLSALLFALLFSINQIVYFTEMAIAGKSISLLSEKEETAFVNWIWFIINFIVVFYIAALVNFSWKGKSVPSNRLEPFNVLFLVLINVLLLVALSTLSSFINKLIIQKYISVYHMALKYLFSFIFGVLSAHILILVGKIRTAEIDYARLKEEKMNAELASLKEQISPHFLFNTLSSLSSVIRSEDKKTSLEFVDKLSQVYRYILESHQNDLVTLKEELKFLDAYAFLLNKRFGQKLVLNIDISPDLDDTIIPPLALQLLVENAIQHNRITESNPLKIQIFADNQMIRVQNNLNKRISSKSFGIGLANLMKRYQLIAEQDIIITKSAELFTVKLPIIK